MLSTRKNENFISVVISAFIIMLFAANAIGQDLPETDVKAMLFKDATIAMKAAKKVQADVLAPKNFGEAMKRYEEAAADFKEGKKLENIKKKLGESTNFFIDAVNATKLANVTFPNSMKARQDAQKSESAKFASKLWEQAERKFNDAAGELEDGDVNSAKEKSSEAEKLYRLAELEAIKSNYLDGTRELLKQADRSNVKDRAPKTLIRAQQLVSQAEKELSENRYDTDVARSLAQQANYEVRHAIYLSKTIKQMKDNDRTWEDVLLESEKPLEQIAEKADLVASFDTGTIKPTNEIVTYIDSYQNKVDELSQDVKRFQQESKLQQARIAEIEQQLGDQTQEKSLLAQQIANQEKIREQFANVEKMFTRDEARVLREENDIIVRLIGLNFPSGKATIEQQSFGLLTKARKAIESFPQCTVSVLGHTDSYGSDDQNQKLSQARADAVKEYIVANTQIDAANVEAIGYGESRPIASNETQSGRTTNRRVEIVIHPSMVEEASPREVSQDR